MGAQSTGIALVGLPGVGKSTIGRAAASLVDLPFVDLDAVVSQRLGMPITEIFRTLGEARFRDAETEALHDMLSEPVVLATGGGIVLRADNRALLRDQTWAVHLLCHQDVLLSRLARDHSRPLLAGSDLPGRLRALHDERGPLYADVSRCTLDCSHWRTARAAREVADLYAQRSTAAHHPAQSHG